MLSRVSPDRSVYGRTSRTEFATTSAPRERRACVHVASVTTSVRPARRALHQLPAAPKPATIGSLPARRAYGPGRARLGSAAWPAWRCCPRPRRGQRGRALRGDSMAAAGEAAPAGSLGKVVGLVVGVTAGSPAPLARRCAPAQQHGRVLQAQKTCRSAGVEGGGAISEPSVVCVCLPECLPLRLPAHTATLGQHIITPLQPCPGRLDWC